MESQIVFTKKGESVFSTQEVLRAFNSTEDLTKIADFVDKAQERLYVSWASVDAKDSAGEHIPIQDIIKNQDILIYKRGGPITDSHTNAVVGKTLAYKVLTHPETRTTGVLHLNKIYNDNIVDDKVWKETQSGERTGSSVGGFSNPNESKYVSMGEDIVKRLGNFNQFETANVFEPCNEFATNVAVSQVAKGDKKMSEKEIEKQLEIKKQAEEESTEKQEVVEDSEAFVNKEEFGALAEAVNQLKDMVAGLTSGGSQEEAEAVEEQAEEEEEVEKEESEEEKKEVGEGEDVAKELAVVKKELAEMKKKFATAKVVKSNARVEDSATNAKAVLDVKKQKKNDLIESAMNGQVDWNEALYGDY